MTEGLTDRPESPKGFSIQQFWLYIKTMPEPQNGSGREIQFIFALKYVEKLV